jgi:hypothetical protein
MPWRSLACGRCSGDMGRGPETALTVLSDGEEGMRTIVGTWFGTRSPHVLDWFHIARRLERISRAFLYLPHIFDFEDRLRRHSEQLGHVRWRLWHGNLDGADWALLWLRASIDEHLFMAQVWSRDRGATAHQPCRVSPHPARGAACVLDGQPGVANQLRRRLLTGRPCRDGAVELTVNQVINRRMCQELSTCSMHEGRSSTAILAATPVSAIVSEKRRETPGFYRSPYHPRHTRAFGPRRVRKACIWLVLTKLD